MVSATSACGTVWTGVHSVEEMVPAVLRAAATGKDSPFRVVLLVVIGGIVVRCDTIAGAYGLMELLVVVVSFIVLVTASGNGREYCWLDASVWLVASELGGVFSTSRLSYSPSSENDE
jgi:hypothetical protein